MPEKLWPSLKPKTLSDIAAAETPCISLITKHHGVDTARAIVIIALTDLATYFNVGNSFNGSQLAQTAELIIDKYYWLKPEDFKLCFNNAKTGAYGIAYNRIDGAVICEWLNKYIDERAAYFENKNITAGKEPVIRIGDTTSMHKLYDQVVEHELERRKNLKTQEELKAMAVKAWHEEYQAHFEGIDITQELHEKYISLYPLNESYIRNFIKKHSK